MPRREDSVSVEEVEAQDERNADLTRERERAVEYGERVLRGEEPWRDGGVEEEEFVSTEKDPESVVEPRNDDVGETGEAGDEVVEVDQDNPAPEPTE